MTVTRLILRESLDDTPPTVVGRTLTVRIATYGRVYSHAGGRERIARGAFREPLARPRGALRFRHIGERPGDDDALENFYGVLTVLREQGSSVIGDFEVFPGAREDKLLRLVNSGAITGASMAAIVKEARLVNDPAGPLTEITRIGTLDGVSITPSPAYDDAQVLAIRESADTRRVAAAAERAWWASLRN